LIKKVGKEWEKPPNKRRRKTNGFNEIPTSKDDPLTSEYV